MRRKVARGADRSISQVGRSRDACLVQNHLTFSVTQCIVSPAKGRVELCGTGRLISLFSIRFEDTAIEAFTEARLSSLHFSQGRSFAALRASSQDDSFSFVILSGAKDLRSAYRARPFAEFPLSGAHVLRMTRGDCSNGQGLFFTLNLA